MLIKKTKKSNNSVKIIHMPLEFHLHARSHISILLILFNSDRKVILLILGFFCKIYNIITFFVSTTIFTYPIWFKSKKMGGGLEQMNPEHILRENWSQ